MNDILDAFYFTWPAWAFIGILGAALLVEEGVVAYNRKKLVDNPTLW
jgi:hypothetical protein